MAASILGFELILNETKLSKAAPFTTRQAEFIEQLKKGTTEFFTRSKNKGIELPQNSKIDVKIYIKAVGDGTEIARNIKFEKIF